MKKVLVTFLCIVFLLVPMMLYASVDFSRYAVILDRRPFGAPVEEEAPPPPKLGKPPAFVHGLRMVAMTESPAGVRVGFLNTRQKPPRSYFLYVGESEDGMLLAQADYDQDKALVTKDGEEYWLRIGEGPAAQNETTPRQRVERPGSSSASARSGASGVIRAGAARVNAPQDSYAERREKRLEEMSKRAAESRKLSEEEVEQKLREYQMRLIRQGRTPLPIPITEEMDRQLVKEGILPPVE